MFELAVSQSRMNTLQDAYNALTKANEYLPLTEPAAVGAWFWRWRSRPIWSVAPDTLQPATVWSPGRDGSRTISTDSGIRESG